MFGGGTTGIGEQCPPASGLTGVSAKAGGHSEMCVKAWVWVRGEGGGALSDDVAVSGVLVTSRLMVDPNIGPDAVLMAAICCSLLLWLFCWLCCSCLSPSRDLSR